jgi:cobalt transporter subunit CbtA
MLFRRIILNAIFAGIAGGLLLSLVQVLTVNPIIFAAEAYEIAGTEVVASHALETVPEPTPNHHGDEHSDSHSHSHSHSHDTWAPADGAERTAYTIFANIFVGIGFAAVLLSIMTQIQVQGIAQLTVAKGFLWGLGGFMAFFVAPSIGMPPEIPGMMAAPLEHRQLWWVLAVLGMGFGLLILAFAPFRWKLIGVAAIALPYVVSIPHFEGVAFSHPDPLVVDALIDLQQQFILFSGLSNLCLWLILGGSCAWLLNRYVLKDANLGDSAHAESV